MAEYYSPVHVLCLFCVHSSMDGHWASFHVLAIVNNATGSLLFLVVFFVCYCVCVLFFFSQISFPSSAFSILHSFVILCLNSPSFVKVFSFLVPLPAACHLLGFLSFSHSVVVQSRRATGAMGRGGVSWGGRHEEPPTFLRGGGGQGGGVL